MKKSNGQIEFLSGTLGAHRQALMGIAILLIMFCHNSVWTRLVLLSQINEHAKSLAQIGVDMFLLCSGFGLCFSYRKSKDLLSFYKKRFLRILPAYFIVMALFCLCQKFFGEDVYLSAKRFSLLSFFMDGEMTIWYLSAILLLYAVYPLLYKLTLSPKRVTLFSAGLVCVSFVIAAVKSVPFPVGLQTVNETFLIRVPLFLLGSFLAQYSRPDPAPVSRKPWAVGAILLTVCFLVNMETVETISWWWLNRLLFFPLTLCFVVLLAPCLQRANGGLLYRMFSFLGGITLELYLIHERVLCYLQSYILPPEVLPRLGSPLESVCINIAAVLISIIFAYCLHKLCQRIFLFRH